MSKSKFNFLIKTSAAGYVLILCFVFAAVASSLNVNVVFGAFLAGTIVGIMPKETFGAVKTHIQEVGLGFFIPVYFAVVGLKLDLIHHFDFGFFLAFLLFAMLIKISGTVISAKLTGMNWFSSWNFAMAMNARGGPCIVLATIAYDLGIINESFFSVLVILAIVTSLLAGYWFQFVLSRGWDLWKE